VLERGVAREAVDLRPQRTRVDVLGADAAATTSGNADASAETAPTAPTFSAGAISPVPDEDVQTLDQVRLELLPGPIGDLHAGEVGRPVAEPLDHGRRHGVPAGDRELVDVEGQRRARRRGGHEVPELGRLVEREVRRRDHSDRVGADLGRVSGENDRVGRRLRAGVDRDLQPPRRRLDEQLGCALALGDREQDPLAVRPQRKQPVEPSRREEVGDRAETFLVERGADVLRAA
jgi:hypothetical protein